MNDSLISRQAAIEAVEHITSSMSVCVNTDECHGMKRMQRQAVIELANLQSAQPEPQWIPCSERLPENDDAVLISHKHGVGKAWWNGRFWSSATKKCYKTVTAWMPLPTAYREDGGE